jgi:ABC-type glycerol-3-phosphate transport system substrate-binding protein
MKKMKRWMLAVLLAALTLTGWGSRAAAATGGDTTYVALVEWQAGGKAGTLLEVRDIDQLETAINQWIKKQ